MFKTERSENSELFQNQIQVYFSWKTKWDGSKNIQEAKKTFLMKFKKKCNIAFSFNNLFLSGGDIWSYEEKMH